jgi:hypothetical protein
VDSNRVFAPEVTYIPNSLDFTGAAPALRKLIDDLYGGVAIPEIALVRQKIEAPRLADIDRAVVEGVARVVGETDRRGPIAVGVGSRGIANIDKIVVAAVRELKRAGFEPFVVPAMGSHGSTQAEGQARILADYGITERTIGAPIRATMETEIVGEIDGIPLHMDRYAVEAGAVFLVSRIKPHTDFDGTIESGLAKMCAIGLAKQRGAQAIHAAGIRGLREVMPKAARLAAARGVLIGGLGIVENARDETAKIVGVRGDEVGGSLEEQLLGEAKRLLPKIPFESLDVLVLDQMGKDVSGSGMDANVIGRWRIPGVEETARPQISCIVVLWLTDASHGNAAGLGLADFIPVRVAERVDLAAFYSNLLTAGIVGIERGQLPIVLGTDRDCVLAAISCCGRTPREPLRMAWITDTLHTETFAVSSALLPELQSRPELEQLGHLQPMPFDAAGLLPPLVSFARQHAA